MSDAARWLAESIYCDLTEMDDSEESPFGPFAVVRQDTPTTLVVSPDQDPDHWLHGLVPDGPVLRVTVEPVDGES